MTATRRQKLPSLNHCAAGVLNTRGRPLRLALFTLALLGLAALPVSGAGPSLEPGIPVTGALTPEDPTLTDGSYYDAYSFFGHMHELVRFHLASSELDVYLLVVDSEGQVLAEDDDSGGGTDAMIEVEIPSDGTYYVLATTFFPESTGEYVLVWEDARTPRLFWGDPVQGQLTPEDEKLPDDTYYDAYLLLGWEGETVRLRLSSAAMDTFLILADAEGNWLATDDDSGGGTDSYLEYTLSSTGAYRVLANTVFPEETGPYTLVWEAGLPEPSSFVELAPGVSIGGEFTEDDLKLEDGTYFDVHFFEGREGQVVRLRLTSADVDAYLILYDTDGNWLASDDDSGGGTDALIVFTLPADGVYMVLANTVFEGETGRYTLTWEEAESLEPGTVVDGALTPGALESDPGPSGRLTLGVPVVGRLSLVDALLDDGSYYDVWYLEGKGGQTIGLRLLATDFEGSLMLWDPRGEVLATSGPGDGTDAYLESTLPEAGLYTVVVHSILPGQTGHYALFWVAASDGDLAGTSGSSGETGPVDGQLVPSGPLTP